MRLARPKPEPPLPFTILDFEPQFKPWREMILTRVAPDLSALRDTLPAPTAAWVVECERMIVALEEVGPLSADDSTIAEVQTLAVLPAFRRFGIGSALLHKALAWAREQGYQELSLSLDVSAGGPDLHRFLEKNGLTLRGYEIALQIEGEASGAVRRASRVSLDDYWGKQRAIKHTIIAALRVYRATLSPTDSSV